MCAKITTIGAFVPDSIDDVQITSSDYPNIQSVEANAFKFFNGKITISGQFDKLETIGDYAFNNAIYTEQQITAELGAWHQLEALYLPLNLSLPDEITETFKPDTGRITVYDVETKEAIYEADWIDTEVSNGNNGNYRGYGVHGNWGQGDFLDGAQDWTVALIAELGKPGAFTYDPTAERGDLVVMLPSWYEANQ